jgi:hypothetical protein
VRYDFLELLLDELNKGNQQYRTVVVQPEFDFEAPANENQVDGDGPAPISNAELNGRLTMRDVILARVDADIKLSGQKGGHFQELFEPSILGRTVPVTRGWTQVDARIRGGPPFRFVNTHLEAFDTGSIRAQQAQELIDGAAKSALPVVLLGDLNSDDDVKLAYLKLRDAGFEERSTGDPSSCCINSPDLREGEGGSVVDFDHQVDHIMTKAPVKVQLVESSVTGRSIQNGFWNSDHAGVFSLLRIPAESEPDTETPPDSTSPEPDSPAGSEPDTETPQDSTPPESP